jgi:hypothetical protein
MSEFEVFYWGAFGGVAGECLGWIKLAKAKQLPLYLSRRFYWVCFVVMILVGGCIAIAHFRNEKGKSPLLYINVGASAPLILSSLSKGIRGK